MGVDQRESLNWSCDLPANEKPMKIFSQTISQSLNDGGDCKTAPDTPGLVISCC